MATANALLRSSNSASGSIRESSIYTFVMNGRAPAGKALRFVLMILILGLSLLPLAVLLLLVPAIIPQESVLTDTVRRSRSLVRDILGRVFSLLTAMGMMLALLAFATEMVTRLNLQSEYFGLLAGKILGPELAGRLPTAMTLGWPYLILIMYATDLLLLCFIGKVPLSYSYRNLLVRWRITLLTGTAFTVVIMLLMVMLGYVNGLNELTSKSGVAGNVIVLSEGATDELFSNLGYGDISKLELEKVQFNYDGSPLAKEIRIKTISDQNKSETINLVSKETYFTINQPIPQPEGQPERRRFAQLRGVQDAIISGEVHNIKLEEGGKWFANSGAITLPDGREATPCVVGEGAAAKFGEEQYGKARLNVGDSFKLGDLLMYVTGIMKSEGSIYGSEVWSQWKRMASEFRKESYTTVVLRVDDDSLQSAELMAYHLSNYFANPRVTARSEPKYFEELGKGNQQLLYTVIVIAIIMAMGGIFGIMNTMFAAIAQRIRDIGVLRILGFKRWQILVSFMLESLFIAIIGGLLGCFLGSLLDGAMLTSTLSSGQGGKTVIMRIIIDTDVFICGILFTIVMGRLGGLVPAISGMRLGILESLK